MNRDIKNISHDIASSRLFAHSGKREITESGDTLPKATNAPDDAPADAGQSQAAQASTKGQKKVEDSDQRPKSTTNELDDSANGENPPIVPQEVNSRPAHQARIYALIGQLWPISIEDRDLRRQFNRASNRVASQIAAEYLSIGRELEAAKRDTDKANREVERLKIALSSRKQSIDQSITSRARTDRPLTREELIGIITEALRDDQVKGTEVSSLTKTIRELVPELFTAQSDGLLDPSAYLEHITRFAGLSGSEIVQQAGGVDWMQQRLSELLKVDVSISPRA